MLYEMKSKNPNNKALSVTNLTDKLVCIGHVKLLPGVPTPVPSMVMARKTSFVDRLWRNGVIEMGASLPIAQEDLKKVESDIDSSKEDDIEKSSEQDENTVDTEEAKAPDATEETSTEVTDEAETVEATEDAVEPEADTNPEDVVETTEEKTVEPEVVEPAAEEVVQSEVKTISKPKTRKS